MKRGVSGRRRRWTRRGGRPSSAVASFAFYRGDAFPGWENDAIVGTLKATELYRFVLDGDRVVHRETLLKGLARIRDVSVGPDGFVYLLLEHASGGRIVRLVPAEPRLAAAQGGMP